MKRTGNTLKLLAGVSLLLGVLSGPAAAQDKPKEIKVGITTFLSGPAAVFGEPGKADPAGFANAPKVSACEPARVLPAAQ